MTLAARLLSSVPQGIGPPSPPLKTPVLGVATYGYPQPALRSVVMGSIKNVPWTQMSTSLDGTLIANNPVDDLIAQIRNGPDAAKRSIKIRIQPGSDYNPTTGVISGGAPAAVRNLAGGPVIVDGFNNNKIAVAKFWSPLVQQAWADLMLKLATAYDNVPEVAEVVMSLGGVEFAEPLVRANQFMPELIAAGWSLQGDLDTYHAGINAMKAFQKTRASMSVSVYRKYTSGTTSTSDLQYAKDIVMYAQDGEGLGGGGLGRQFIAGNNEWGRVPYAAWQTDLYAWFQARTQYYHYYQQDNCGHSPNKGNQGYVNDFSNAAANGAIMIEADPGSSYTTTCDGSAYPTGAQIQAPDTALRANYR